MRNTHFNARNKNAQAALRFAHPKPTMAAMKTGEKIREIRKAKKLTIDEVEHAVGLSAGNLSRIERGEQWISEEKLHGLAAALGVKVADFFTEEPFDKNVAPAESPMHAIPVISAVQAGLLKEVTDSYAPGAGFDVIYTDMDISSRAFALEIEGESMLPEFRPGDRVIIDPDLQPNPGDFVVAKNGEEEATFKKYRPRSINAAGQTIFELVPLNEDYPTMRSDLQELYVIGVMVEHRKKYRRR